MPTSYRPPSHNLGDSRRSPRDPRDPSPARYNDRIERNERDEYRGGSHGSERRRSIPDIRSNNNAFNSNRDTFREPMGREPPREFPPRDTPRGPKNLIDAPTGPRASSYGSDFRGDRGEYGYRGDYRGDRGRGRGRGWRDDSRDRARDIDRNYRRDRDDRGPPHFRDEPGRERWGREPYNVRARRPNSPPGRPRSPPYAPRDNRDAPPNIEVDRARRSSRDGPLSGGSPSSDGVGFPRGFSRPPRGNIRGRGRGGYYDDHRRSRSPDPAWSRRTQPSATPPPQVPAFGSNMPVSGPVPGVAVPTAPRSQRVGYIKNRAPTSLQLINDQPKQDAAGNFPPIAHEKPLETAAKDDHHVHAVKHDDTAKHAAADLHPQPEPEEPEKTTAQSVRKRRPVIGKRQPKVVVHDVSDVEDSGDDLDDDYFEEEITKVQKQIEQVPKENPLMPREDPEAPFLKPFIDANIDEVPSASKLSMPEPCVAPEVKKEAAVSELVLPSSIPATEPLRDSSAPRPTSQGKSRPTTPLLEPHRVETETMPRKNVVAESIVPLSSSAKLVEQTEAAPSTTNSLSSAAERALRKEAVIPPWNPTASLPVPRPSSRHSSVGPNSGASAQESTKDSAKEPATPIMDHTRSPLGVNAGFLEDRISPQEAANSESSSIATVPVSQPLNLDGFLAGPMRPFPRSSANGSSTRRSSTTPSNAAAEGSRDAAGGDHIIAPKPRKPEMDTFSDDEDEPPITAEELEAVRPFMKTPPIDSLPKFDCKPFWLNDEFMESQRALFADEPTKARVRQKIIDDEYRIQCEQDEEKELYKQRMISYRRFTDHSDDEIAVKSREKFAKSRAKAALEAATPHPSTLPSSNAKPEGRHRIGSRNATEHDFERVLRESEQEARLKKMQDDQAAREKTANAKEATIPNQCWNQEEWDKKAYSDRTGLVSFDRSFARLEFGEPIDNFTEAECKIFEEAYLEFPKQFSKIAEQLPGRDYKVCIQHYYLVKQKLNLKERLKKKPKGRKRKAGKNPKSNALMADLGLTIRDEGEDGQDAETGERRRPRRAAAPTWPIETPASESEVASPAPTPGRKPAASKGGDSNTDTPPVKRKTKAAREKASKQTKSNPLLAAAPSISVSRQPESPAPTPLPSTDWKNRREPSANPRPPPQLPPQIPPQLPPQFDGSSQPPPMFPSTLAPAEKPIHSLPANQEMVPQPTYVQQERLESAPPSGFEPQPDRRSIQQTSSYWSVPEQTEFPALLKHFGTDWHGIAKHMTSKTHIMVYTNLFKWLAVPSDSNKSRLVANIQTQVKNYYQRQVDSGKMKEWEDFTRDADARRDRGEMPPDLPPSTMPPKRRYDITPSALPRSGSAMDGGEDIASATQSKLLSQASPTQPSLSSRFPALAQAGPVPQIKPATSTSVLNKHLPPQPIQQAAQQVQQAPRPPRGPALGYFTQNEPRDVRELSRDPRPIMQANTPVSERSLMVAQEAHAERQRAESALRMQSERQTDQQREQQAAMQREQQQLQQQQLLQQQQAQQRERQFQMKQEPETPDLRQYEAFSTTQIHSNNVVQARPEPPKVVPPPTPEPRRTTAPPPHQYQPRVHHPGRSFLSENIAGVREIKSTPSPAGPRPPMSAPPAAQEQYPVPPPPTLQQPPPQHRQQMPQAQPQTAPHIQAPPQPAAPVRPQETVRKTSSIMSLLNDEPSDPRPTPTKRVSDVSSSSLQPSRTPPPPQHSLQTSRYAAHSSQASAQAPQMSQQLGVQPSAQQQVQPPPSQHSYGQPSPHPLHQHSSSIGQTRSYTPTSFDRGGYGQTPVQQQQNIQQMYSQPPPRSTMTSQPPPIRREQSLGDIHGVSNGYRSSAPSQSRLKESPYSQPTPPPQGQPQRQSAGSPMDLAPSTDRDYYSRQPQSSYLMQQQQSATSSPQLGSYHPQTIQQPQPTHRQLAFGQGPAHVASPPPQYVNSHALHRSRGNSFDGRFQMSTSAPGPVPQGYAQAPQHQQTPPAGPPMQYQQQHQPLERYESSYERNERERRMQEEAYHQHQHQRRVEEQRRMDESRR